MALPNIPVNKPTSAPNLQVFSGKSYEMTQEGPKLSTTKQEAIGTVVMNLLDGKDPEFQLRKDDYEQATKLFTAIKSGNKEAVIKLSETIFGKINREQIALAYQSTSAEVTSHHPTYTIIMNHLGKSLEKIKPANTTLTREDAAAYLLLTLANHPSKVITTSAIDEKTGRLTTSSFALSKENLGTFVQEMGVEPNGILEKALYFVENVAIPNVAAKVSADYDSKKKEYQKVKESWDAEQSAQNLGNSYNEKLNGATQSPEKAASFNDRLAGLFSFLDPTNAKEQQALVALLTDAEEMSKLRAQGKTANKDTFMGMLTAIFLKRLDPNKAAEIAMKMVDSFLALIQELAQMKDWTQWYLNRIHTVSGKKPYLRAVLERTTTIEDLLEKFNSAERIRLDKQAGQKKKASWEGRNDLSAEEQIGLTAKQIADKAKAADILKVDVPKAASYVDEVTAKALKIQQQAEASQKRNAAYAQPIETRTFDPQALNAQLEKQQKLADAAKTRKMVEEKLAQARGQTQQNNPNSFITTTPYTPNRRPPAFS